MKWLHRFSRKNELWVGLSLTAVLFLVIGVNQAFRSNLFRVKTIEVTILNRESTKPQPLTEAVIRDKVLQVAKESQNLFEVKLEEVEKVLREDPWIREISLKRKLPSSLEIEVTLRKPIALVQEASGRLSYLDQDGLRFGSLALETDSDLPILMGEMADQPETALSFLAKWAESELSRWSQISTLRYDPQYGYQALFLYALPGEARIVRSFLSLGQNIDSLSGDEFSRIAQVLRYLSQKSLSIREMILGDGKKIVVKTNRRS